MEEVVHTLVFFLVNGCVMFSSWRLAEYLLNDNRAIAMRFVATGILAFAHATFVVLFLGVVVRSLDVWSVSLMSLALSAAVIVMTRKLVRPLSFLCSIRLCWQEYVHGQRDYALYVLVILFVIQVLVMLFKVVWLPPHVVDVFTYHLPPAVEWYQQGWIPPELETTVNRINGAPLGMTVLAYWFFIFFHDDMLVELPMFLWALLLVPASIAIMRQAGMSRPWAIKFAIVIFFIPIVLMQGISVKDHLGMNVSMIAGVLFLAEFIKTKKYSLILLAAMAIGLMLGYKIVAPIHAVIMLLVFGLLLWLRQRDVFTDAAERLALLKAGVSSLGLVLLLGGYWYLRNMLVYGRLQGAYGIELDEAGHQIFRSSGALEAVTTKIERTGLFFNNLSELLPRWFDYNYFYIADLNSISGFGPQFAAFGVVALILFSISCFDKDARQQPVFMFACTAILLFFVLMFLNYNSNSYRMLSFFPMILIIYTAVQLHVYGLLQRDGSSLAVNAMLFLSVLWCGGMMLPPQQTNLLRFKEFVSLDSEERSTANYTRWFVLQRPSLYHLLSNIPVSEPLVHVSYRKSFWPHESRAGSWSYPYYDRHWKRKLYNLRLPEYFECEGTTCRVKPELKEFMQKNKVSLLSSCKLNFCLKISDREFFELMPGLYYYQAKL